MNVWDQEKSTYPNDAHKQQIVPGSLGLMVGVSFLYGKQPQKAVFPFALMLLSPPRLVFVLQSCLDVDLELCIPPC